MRFDCVLFDLDGTLTDSAPGILRSFRLALEEVDPTSHALTLDSAELASRIVGPPMIDTFASLLPPPEAAIAFAAYTSRYAEAGWSENVVYDGIGELLAELHGAEVRLAVATSKAEPIAVDVLRHFHLDGYFETICGASVDGSRRAKAAVIAEALRRLGLSAGAAGVLMVGDRHHDIEGALAHGLSVAAVGWGYGGADEHGGATWELARPADLLPIVG